ncbi:MAG: EAL domain-containing protein, partial [Rudaea sp.]|nr:EAL domain-containing protein [Rudaea sp.]
DEYWPLLRIAPQERKPLLGFDLASEAQRRAALLQSQSGGLAASARSISLRADGEHVPAVFLYLPTVDPRGAVVAPLKIQALLGGHGMSRELLAGGHDLQLTNAGGETLAEMPAGPTRIRNADPHLAQEFTLKIGSDVWHLTVATSKMALPYLSAPLWWLGQALPQLLCVLIGLFLALIANNDRRIFQLERYYAGYVEGLRKSAVPQTQAALFDAEIEGAWNERAFEPRFEPIVDIRSGEIRGAEALLRWPGAPEGLTTGDIIEWAERKNLIGDLDRGILSATLRAVASWPLARLPNFAISVNVSASEMQNPQWAGHVLQELARYRVPGRNLCFEITEGVLIRSDSVVLDQLALLREAGVRIALDDFGTGYSSIAYLRQLPVDRIKLDRAFVSDLAADDKARRIVASILALGRTLEIDLVAEAVEDSRTVKVLRELGCQLAQGWFFSHTIGAQAMRDLLNTQLNGQRTRRA